MFEVVFTKSAHKEYRALPRRARAAVDEALELLRINPVSELLKIKKIHGRENHFRVRVGDYRVVYTPHFAQVRIHVIRVGHRKDVYRYFS